MAGRLRMRQLLGAASVLAVAWLAMPVAAQAATNDLGVTQTLSASKVKPGGTVEVTSTVTNLGTQAASESFVELSTLRGKILTQDANDPYTSFSSSQGSCKARGGHNNILECALGALAPGQSATVQATIQVRQSAVETTTLIPNPSENEYKDAEKSNDERFASIYLDVPPVVSGSKQVKLIGLPKSCVTSNFTLTVISKNPGTKKMRLNVDLGFNTTNGKHLLFSKEVHGKKIKMRIPATKAELQIDAGNFPSYTLTVKAKQGGGRSQTTKIEFKRC